MRRRFVLLLPPYIHHERRGNQVELKPLFTGQWNCSECIFEPRGERESKWASEGKSIKGRRTGGGRGEGPDPSSSLLPSTISTFHPSVFPSPLFPKSVASDSSLARWRPGPPLWRRYKVIARAHRPTLWYLFCQNCHWLFSCFMLCEQTRTMTYTLDWNVPLH